MSQSIFPMIAYEDAAAAMDWLVVAFGFRERCRMTDKAGRVGHGELELSGNIVMVASPTPDYQSPKRHAESCAAARQWLSVPWIIDGALVHVDDVDAHYKQAKAAGATTVSGISGSFPGSLYRVPDLERHSPVFGQAQSKRNTKAS